MCIVGISTTSLAMCLAVSTRLFMKEMRFTALENKQLGASYGYVQRAGTLVTMGMTLSYVSLIWLLAMRLSLNQSTRLFSQTPIPIITTAIAASGIAGYYLLENTCRVTFSISTGNKTWVFIAALYVTEQRYIAECENAKELLKTTTRKQEFEDLIKEFKKFLVRGQALSITNPDMVKSTITAMEDEDETFLAELEQHNSHLRNYANQHTNNVVVTNLDNWKTVLFQAICNVFTVLFQALFQAIRRPRDTLKGICCPGEILAERLKRDRVAMMAGNGVMAGNLERVPLLDDIIF